MNIHGLQKMTLLDFPGKVACTLFTGGCNYRCPFCHNALLVTKTEAPLYTEEEILAFLKKRQGLLDGVCITGGEPLLRPDIAAFIEKVRALGYAVKLDTNGSFPDKLKELIDAGLVDRVAMDIKNRREKYAATAGIPDDKADAVLAAVDKSIALLLEERVDYEFRTTVAAELHTVEDIAAAAKWIGGAKRYFLQSFVDSGDLVGDTALSAPSAEVMEQMRAAAAPFVKEVTLRGVS